MPPHPTVDNDLAYLVPFFIAVCIYTIIHVISSAPVWLLGLTKILPIISLCIFVVCKICQYNHRNHRKLLMGLTCSAMGDAFLLKDDNQFLIGGGAMFALAHCLYTWAFGFKPLNLQAASLVALVVGLGWIFLSMCSKVWQMLLLCCYCTLIGIMSWRANAEVLFHHSRTRTKVTGAIGAVLFMVSDFTLAINLLCFQVPHNQLIVMSTYYAAQLFITISIVRDNQNKSD
ncbi:lysoplasmalogenase TMEM86A-like isoform X1 [Chiloscyllium punctatum]|uniref:lysoplasmalogenase n=1 Tax=Chiloscyllium punctatum TaxID=137246 RepID=A0A401RY19_CHIPU|nr:hypothetical protein [Chiloscyllium punctatum]